MKRQAYEDIQIPEQLSEAVRKGIEKGKKVQRRKQRKNIAMIAGSAAAILVVFFTYCFANPAFASELPFIGSIFARTEQKGEFPGDYSKKAEKLEEAVQEGSSDNQTQGELASKGGDTDQNITVIPKEVYCDGSSLYVGFLLKTKDEAGFGLDLGKEGMDWYQLDYSVINIGGTWSDGNGEYNLGERLIGEQIAEDTFVGRMKIFMEDFPEDMEKIEMHISTIYWENLNKLSELRETENVSFSDYGVIKDGDWNLTVQVKVDKSQVKKVSVNETNEAGFGIKNITVTPYEVCIESILPEMDNDSLNQMCREYKNTCVQQLGEEAAEQFLAEGSFDSGYPGWEGGFAVFDQNGERVPYGYVLDDEEVHQAEAREINKLYFYLMPDGVIAYKCQDQSIAEKCNIFSYVLELN